MKSTMKLSCFKFSSVALILLVTLPVGFCAPTKSPTRSLADNYTALAEDVKWFFRGVQKLAGTVEQMLPNVSTDLAKTRTFSENTRVTLLIGLRHLLVGIREIAMTFEQSFKTDHIKQLHQLKNVTSFANDLMSALKIWFSRIRAIVMHILLLYNRYIPEVLFGKCLGNYLMTAYPERSYYEYPLILISEIYTSMLTAIHIETLSNESATELPIFDPDMNMEQNEISSADDLHASYDSKLTQQLPINATETPLNSESFFDLSNVLNSDKEKIIENAVNQQSWQICLKLYTAESISRSLKIFFLGL